MPKNSNQASPLDKLEVEMEQEQAQQAQATTSQQPAPGPEQTATQQAQAQANNYTPAQDEKHLYHVELEKPYFDKRTGKRLSTPVVQKFTETEYKQLTGKRNEKDKSNAEMLGYTVKVLWNPKENI